MPIYEFLCRSCGTLFERLVSLNGVHGVSCSECGSADVEKKPSTFGIGGGGGRIKAASSSCSSCSSHSCSTCR
jgi:putative FmdB family regulatory protein